MVTRILQNYVCIYKRAHRSGHVAGRVRVPALDNEAGRLEEALDAVGQARVGARVAAVADGLAANLVHALLPAQVSQAHRRPKELRFPRLDLIFLKYIF